jgi:predicted unusual protein kinase regulating ubiquinone biosynthesis (AarF/ABC1/UbiB family)
MKSLKEVTAPIPKFELTSRKVLTMEWIDGVRLTDASP